MREEIKIEKLYRDDKRPNEIADLLDIPIETVIKHIASLQIQDTTQEIKRLYNNGKGKKIKEIAEQLGISLPTVTANIKHLENKRRDR